MRNSKEAARRAAWLGQAHPNVMLTPRWNEQLATGNSVRRESAAAVGRWEGGLRTMERAIVSSPRA
jgi:hypothetical protein